MRRIGILGQAASAEVRALRDALQTQGASATIVDFHGFPRLHTLAWAERLLFDDIKLGAIALDEHDAWHLRAAAYEPMPDGAAPAVTSDTIARHHGRQVARLAVQRAVARRMARRVPVINPPDAFRLHHQKAFQHALLIRHGVSTPETLVTSDPALAQGFVQRWAGRVVAKPQASGAEVVMADARFFATFGARGECRPTMFQQFVRGSSFRAYVLGGRIVSMGRVVPEPGYVDWRERVQAIVRAQPTDTLATQVATAVRLLGLPCCGVDIEHDEATGKDYLLDFNPAAMFVFWSRRTGDDVPRSMASYLIACADAGAPRWEA